MYLREQIDAIHEELGDDDVGSQAAKYLHKLEKLKAPKRVKRRFVKKLCVISVLPKIHRKVK